MIWIDGGTSATAHGKPNKMLQLITYSALLRKWRNENTLVLFKKTISQPNKITIPSDHNFLMAIIFREVCLHPKLLCHQLSKEFDE